MATYLSITPPGENLSLQLPANDRGIIAADIVLRRSIGLLSKDDLFAPAQRKAPAGIIKDYAFDGLMLEERAEKHASVSLGQEEATIWKLPDGSACLSFRNTDTTENALFPCAFLLDGSRQSGLEDEVHAWRGIQDTLPRLHLTESSTPRPDVSIPSWLPHSLITDKDRQYMARFTYKLLLSAPARFPGLQPGSIREIAIQSRPILRDGSLLDPEIGFDFSHPDKKIAQSLHKTLLDTFSRSIIDRLSQPDFPVPPERQVALTRITMILDGYTDRLHDRMLLSAARLGRDQAPSAHEIIQALNETRDVETRDIETIIS